MGIEKNRMMEEEGQRAAAKDRQLLGYKRKLLADGKYSGHDCPNCGYAWSIRDQKRASCPNPE